MSETDIQELLSREHLEAGRVLAAAQKEAATILAAAKFSAQVWKWIAGSLIAVIFAIASTYFATAKDYVTKSDFTELKTLVTRNAEDLNRLIGKVDVHLTEKK